ncbi:MAG: NAD-dependent epimerase/dehydratase family protein [Paludibacter sp.]|jgi:nucleoside-diphosphate-sugar epimerase
MNTILFTGASGFIGENLLPILQKKYSVKTLGLTDRDDYNVNIAVEAPVFIERFDLVLHAAGKAHSLPKTEAEKKAFFDVNLQGTINLCKALEICGTPKSFIFVSTVAVYGLEFGENITEEYPLMANTPYGLSKIQAELFLIDWCMKYNVILSIVRPPLIAGPNPPGNLGAMIRGIKSGKYFHISGYEANKSILMVEDLAILLPKLAAKGGIYNVSDSEHPSFRELEKLIALQLGKSLPFSISYNFAKNIAYVGDLLGRKFPINTIKLEKMTKSLTFSNEKARNELSWEPINVLKNFKIK